MKKIIINVICLALTGLNAREAAPVYNSSKNTTTFKDMHAVHAYELKRAIKLYNKKRYDYAYYAFSRLAELKGVSRN